VNRRQLPAYNKVESGMNIGDIYRYIVGHVDEMLMRIFGNRIIHFSREESDERWNGDAKEIFLYKPSLLRGYYNLTPPSNTYFSNSSDEMLIHLPWRTTLFVIPGIPLIGDILLDEFAGRWQIVARHYNGQGRLTLTVNRISTFNSSSVKNQKVGAQND
jgi:hypothetical protein